MILTQESSAKRKKFKSELRFDLSDDRATKWLVAYMKWYLYVNDVETISNN